MQQAIYVLQQIWLGNQTSAWYTNSSYTGTALINSTAAGIPGHYTSFKRSSFGGIKVLVRQLLAR
ncbi:MAG: hypothetical protein ABIN36_10120 [Ferruginibacter sp.]